MYSVSLLHMHYSTANLENRYIYTYIYILVSNLPFLFSVFRSSTKSQLFAEKTLA